MPQKQIQVLVVDDDKQWRFLVRRVVEKLGYAVTEAENAAGAEDLIDRPHRFDLLITDNWMGGYDAGIELLIRNKLLGYEVPSILHTSYLSQVQQIRLRQEVPEVIGVVKSSNPDYPELVAAIQKLVPH